jgi:hypothetical protein
MIRAFVFDYPCTMTNFGLIASPIVELPRQEFQGEDSQRSLTAHSDVLVFTSMMTLIDIISLLVRFDHGSSIYCSVVALHARVSGFPACPIPALTTIRHAQLHSYMV